MTLGTTAIPYLTRLYHPTTGCSAGCRYCWARPLVRNRLAGTMKGLVHPVGWLPSAQCDPFAPTFHSDRLADPLRVRKPQVIGVSFLGDLFDPAITDEQIAAVFGVMAAAPQHTFVLLTKQAERLVRWFGWAGIDRCASKDSAVRFCLSVADGMIDRRHHVDYPAWPLPNVWLGVSVEDQATADARIPHLLRTPAAHRWVSLEPMRGAVNLRQWMPTDRWYNARCEACGYTATTERWDVAHYFDDSSVVCPHCGAVDDETEVGTIGLLILGGMSGTGAEPLHPGWVRAVRDACAAAGVAFVLKQRGEWTWQNWADATHAVHSDGRCLPVKDVPGATPGVPRFLGQPEKDADGGWWCGVKRVGVKAAGRLLDGKEHWDLPWRALLPEDRR